MRTAVCLQGVDTPEVFEQHVGLIDRLGYDALWLTDSSLHSRNCWAYLTLAARASDRLRIGTAVTNPVTRHPAITAVAAATVAEISGGRVTLGIGAGDRPLLSLGESRPAWPTWRSPSRSIRALWAGEHVTAAARGFGLDDAHYRFAPAPGHSHLGVGHRPEDAGAGGPGRRRRDPAGGPAPGWHPLRARPHRPRRRAGGRDRPEVTVFAYGAIDDEDEAAAFAAARSDRRLVPADVAGVLRDRRAAGRPWWSRCGRLLRRGVPGGGPRGRSRCRTSSCTGWRWPAARTRPAEHIRTPGRARHRLA